MTIRARRLTLAGASIALALVIGVLGVTAAQGDTTLAIPLDVSDMVKLGIVGGIALAVKRMLGYLDSISKGLTKISETVTTLETLISGVEGRGGLLDDVRDLQSTVYREPRPVAAPAGFSVSPMPVAAKEPT